MDSRTRVQIQDETVCISFRAKALAKDMNPSLLAHPTTRIMKNLNPNKRDSAEKLTLCRILPKSEKFC